MTHARLVLLNSNRGPSSCGPALPMTIIHIIVWVITGRRIINEIVEWLCENEK
jgi:hypothetical protein